MRKLKVTVNGITYEVEVEEVESTGAFEHSSVPSGPSAMHPSPPAVSPEASTNKEQRTPTSHIPPEGTETITAPMPGTIVSLHASKGQQVKKGDVLLVLEAMKMENEIASTRDGTVVQIYVNKGESVESGANLVSLG